MKKILSGKTKLKRKKLPLDPKAVKCSLGLLAEICNPSLALVEVLSSIIKSLSSVSGMSCCATCTMRREAVRCHSCQWNSFSAETGSKHVLLLTFLILIQQTYKTKRTSLFHENNCRPGVNLAFMP